jgi:hypothetical protein
MWYLGCCHNETFDQVNMKTSHSTDTSDLQARNFWTTTSKLHITLRNYFGFFAVSSKIEREVQETSMFPTIFENDSERNPFKPKACSQSRTISPSPQIKMYENSTQKISKHPHVDFSNSISNPRIRPRERIKSADGGLEEAAVSEKDVISTESGRISALRRRWRERLQEGERESDFGGIAAMVLVAMAVGLLVRICVGIVSGFK